MKQSEKLNQLISCMKTTNELMKKQLDINQRCIELLGEFITEPESLGKAPYSDKVTSLPNIVGQEIESGNESIELEKQSDFVQACVWWVTLPRETMLNFRKTYCNTQTGLVSDDKIEEIWRKETKQVEPTNIKVEDMKAGEWYVVKSWYNWMFKFRKISKQEIYTFKHISLDGKDCSLKGGNLTQLNRIKSLRKATQEEIIKYFPNELEVPTHGGNDAGYIQEVTDPQV